MPHLKLVKCEWNVGFDLNLNVQTLTTFGLLGPCPTISNTVYIVLDRKQSRFNHCSRNPFVFYSVMGIWYTRIEAKFDLVFLLFSCYNESTKSIYVCFSALVGYCWGTAWCKYHYFIVDDVDLLLVLMCPDTWTPQEAITSHCNMYSNHDFMTNDPYICHGMYSYFRTKDYCWIQCILRYTNMTLMGCDNWYGWPVRNAGFV